MKPKRPTTAFGSMIRATRKEWDMTQEDFGPLFGLSGVYISAIERGNKTPPLGTQAHIRRIINLGKEKATRQAKTEKITSQHPPRLGHGYYDARTLDCTPVVHAIAASGLSVTINDLLWLMEIQQTLPSPMEASLVAELLKNRHKETK